MVILTVFLQLSIAFHFLFYNSIMTQLAKVPLGWDQAFNI